MISHKHHYLSRFYIKAFSDQNGLVWTYPKYDIEKLFSGKPENTTFKNKLYHLDLDGLDTNPEIDIIENYLANNIESPAANALNELRERKFPNGEQRKNLSKFFGFLFVRTPSLMKHLKSPFDDNIEKYSLLLASNKKNYHNSWKQFDPNSSDSEIEESRILILNGKTKYGAHPHFILNKMISSGSIIGELLSNMHWVIIDNVGILPFITSDNLINISYPYIPPNKFYHPGFGMSDVRVIIPLSEKLSLLMLNSKDRNNSMQTADNTLVKVFNKLIYLLSNKYVFAGSNSTELRSFLNECLAELNAVSCK